MMPFCRSAVVALPFIVACLLAATDAGAADWRRARVLGMATRATVDVAIDADCAPPKPGSEDDLVVVVSYRVGKSSYVRALEIADDDAFEAHEEVLVDPGACRVSHRTAARPGSAPPLP